MNTIKNLIFKYKEIIMYLIMGVATTFVNWAVYAVAITTIHTGVKINTFDFDLLVSNVIAWIISVIFAYVTNKIFVFESHSWQISFVIREFILFVSARLLTGAIEIFGLPFLVGLGLDGKIFGIEGMVSKILISIIVVILNYIFSKLIIFKKESP